MAPTSTQASSAPGSPASKRAAKRLTPVHTARTEDQGDAAAPKPSPIGTSSRSASMPSVVPDTEISNSFETNAAADGDDIPPPPRTSVDLEELPIELIGLTDSFIEALQAKTQPTPPTIGDLTQRFQDFYATASSHIATHIAALATRQNRAWQGKRDHSPPPPLTSRSSTASLLRSKAASITGRDRSRAASGVSSAPPAPTAASSSQQSPVKSEPEQQMVTAEELATRKRARRALEQKRALLEEAVERRLCEGIYERIYRHRATQDEAQDEKLRSKTAALDVVGIGPADLGVDLGGGASPAAVEDVRQWLAGARQELVRMSEAHYPLGKLNRLKAVHKGIVDTLAHFHPSSSADEIMPMLIYTLITLPPAQLSVVSDLGFVQRFRWEPKIEGEAAYCLTNLEAAISFLETVDLSTLRADEAPSGPVKGTGSEPTTTTTTTTTPKTETFPPAYVAQQGLSDASATATKTEAFTDTSGTSAAAAGLRAAVQLRNRRLSELVNTPAAQALSTASDAVMNTFSAADQGLKTIGNSLEGSYRLLFGRLGQPATASVTATTAAVAPTTVTSSLSPMTGTDGPSDGTHVLLPKTLDEVRKLVTTPPPLPASEDEASVNGEELVRSVSASAIKLHPSRDDRMLLQVSGRKALGTSGLAPRDHSADSAQSGRSGRSGRSAASSAAATRKPDEEGATAAAPVNPAANAALLDSVRHLGSSFNPMSRLSGLGSLRGFGRTVSSSSSSAAVAVTDKDKAADGGDLATAFPDLAAALPPKAPVAPPIQRLLELNSPADLRLGEVTELLRDYRRLATVLKDMGAFRKE